MYFVGPVWPNFDQGLVVAEKKKDAARIGVQQDTGVSGRRGRGGVVAGRGGAPEYEV
jgi:hypothetical protein